MHDFYDFSDLELGMRVNVEGTFDGAGGLKARSISIKQDGDQAELEAQIEAADPGARSLQMLGLTLHLPAGIEIRGLDRQPLQPDALAAGTRIKAKGSLREGRRFEPEKIKVKRRTPDAHDEIEGEITSLDPQQRAFTVLGFRIACDEDVEIEA